MHPAISDVRTAGVLGNFARAIITDQTAITDHELDAWTLIPLVVPMGDKRTEETRACVLVNVMTVCMLDVLRHHGDAGHVSMLRAAYHATTTNGHTAVAKVLDRMRLHRPYDRSPVGFLSWCAFEAEQNAYGRQPRPVVAAEHAGKFFAYLAYAFGRQDAIDAAAAAMTLAGWRALGTAVAS